MKKSFLFLVMMIILSMVHAQPGQLYHPEADAAKELAAVIQKAAAQKKYVLIQAGGNWCSWCIEFARLSKVTPKLDSVINAGFILYHLNWSKENQNKKIFNQYGNAQRFGFPVFIILNEKGERIHTQNSEYLEDGKKSYNTSKVQSFLEMWSPRALNPEMYGG